MTPSPGQELSKAVALPSAQATELDRLIGKAEDAHSGRLPADRLKRRV